MRARISQLFQIKFLLFTYFFIIFIMIFLLRHLLMKLIYYPIFHHFIIIIVHLKTISPFQQKFIQNMHYLKFLVRVINRLDFIEFLRVLILLFA